MTIYGQTLGAFKREINECIRNGERTKLHKIICSFLPLQMWCYDAYFATNYVIMGRHEALRNVSQDWLRKLYTNNGNNGP